MDRTWRVDADVEGAPAAASDALRQDRAQSGTARHHAEVQGAPEIHAVAERDRGIDRDVLGDHIGQAEHDRNGEHDAAPREERRVRERVARMARRTGTPASSPANQGGDRDQQLNGVERQENHQQGVHCRPTISPR